MIFTALTILAFLFNTLDSLVSLVHTRLMDLLGSLHVALIASIVLSVDLLCPVQIFVLYVLLPIVLSLSIATRVLVLALAVRPKTMRKNNDIFSENLWLNEVWW